MAINPKLMSQLRKLDGAVQITEQDPLNGPCLKAPCPSVNWAFGIPGQGLPFGLGMLLYGPPKGGKSILCNAFVGQLHKDDPEAVAVCFNTELRGEFQANLAQMRTWGIDPERYIVFDVSQPELIFDRIEKDIADLCQQGLKIKLVIIDSLTGIQGRRSLNADSVSSQQIGDHAATIKDGLKRVVPIFRKHKIAYIGTDHVRAEMDQKEIMRGKTVKMASAWAAKHTFEIFAYAEPNKSKAGRVSLAGEEFLDKETVDFMENAQRTGHKIRFRVEESSVGPAMRTAEFTLDYEKGIVNQYEEVFTLAKNLNILQRPNQTTYAFGDKTFRGIVNCLTTIRDDQTLYDQLLSEIVKTDAR